MKRKPALGFVAFTLLVAAPSVLRAQNPPFTWTGTGGDFNFTNDANWLGGSAPTGSGTEDAEFGDAGKPSVIINSSVSLNDITFDGSYSYYNLFGADTVPTITLNGAINSPSDSNYRNAFLDSNIQIALPAGNHTVDTGSGLYLDIDGEVSGTGGLTKSGNGRLTLWNSANSFSGGLTITEGNVTLGANGAAGTGTIKILGSDTNTGLYNASNDTLTIGNNLVLGDYASFIAYYGQIRLTGPVTAAAGVTDVTILNWGDNPLFFSGNFSGSGVSYSFDNYYGNGVTVLEGTNDYDGGTHVDSGALVFSKAESIPTDGLITVSDGAYAGIGDTSVTGGISGLTRFLTHLDPATTYGVVGIDSDPSGGANVFGDVDLSAFPSSLYFGSVSIAVLKGAFTPPTAASGYDFGGRGALVMENSNAFEDIDGSNPRAVRSNTIGTTDEPFVLVLRSQGPSNETVTNTYTGGTYAYDAGIIFDSAGAVPAQGVFSYAGSGSGYGPYIGITENAGIGGETFTPADLVERIRTSDLTLGPDSHPSNAVIGFDSHSMIDAVINGGTGTPVTITDLDLSALTGSIYVGSVTKAILAGTFTPTDGGSGNYFFTGYKGGELQVNSLLTDADTVPVSTGPQPFFTTESLPRGFDSASRSVTIGLPYVTDQSGSGTVRITNGANDYTGDTYLLSGELYLDASTNGPSGAFTTGPIGTGTLHSEPSSSSATLGFGSSPNQFANDVDIVNSDLQLESNNPSGLTLSGWIDGTGRLVFDTSDPIRLTHANTYSGGTLLQAPSGSAVFADNDTALGTGLVDLENGSSLTFTTSAPHIYGLQDNYFSFSEGANTVTLAAGSTLTIDAPPHEVAIAGGMGFTQSVSFSGNIVEGSASPGSVPTGPSVQFAGPDPGASLVKTGDSIQYLYGNSTYTGGTTITGGVIIAGSNTALGSGPVLIDIALDEAHSNRSGGLGISPGVTIPNAVLFGAGGGVIGGGGTFSTPSTIVIGTNAVLKPGDRSAGTLSFTNGLEWAAGGSYDITVQMANGSPGNGYDLLNITGALTFTADTGSPFNLSLYSVDSFGNQVSLSDFNPNNAYSWTIAQTTAGFTDGEIGLTSFPSGAFTLDYSSFSGYNNLNGGSFSLNISGNDLLLSFNPAVVPEPSTWALLLCGLGAVGLLARRRQHG